MALLFDQRGVLAAACCLLLLALPARAQERPTEEDEEPGGRTDTSEENLYDDLVAQFQRDYLRFTALIQIVPQIALEDTEGNQGRFDVSAARFGIGGRLDGGIGYRLQTDFARAPAVLDAFVSYQPGDAAEFLVGRYKAPFSFEFLTSAANTDFVNRARVVRALAPGRQVGASVQVPLAGEALALRAGVFNAAFKRAADGDAASQAERGGFLLAARAQSTLQPADGTALIVGVNLAYDTPDMSDALDVPGRLLMGADARLRFGRLLFAAEGIVEQTEGDAFPDRDGFFLTAGYDLDASNRLLVRLDELDGSGEVLLGYNLTLTRAAGFQANVILPLDDEAEATQVLFNFQIGF